MKTNTQLMLRFGDVITHFIYHISICVALRFFIEKMGKGIMNSLIDKLPIELHIPKVSILKRKHT